MNPPEIPTLDVSPLFENSGVNLAATVRALDEALHETGFLYVKNHGIDPSLPENIMALAREFFGESAGFKNEIAMKHAGLAWRGFFPVGGELTMGRPDQKEGIYFGAELSTEHPAVKNGTPLHGANLWPRGEKFARFKPLVLEYISKLTGLGQVLMEGIGMGLGLPRDYFKTRFTSEPTTLFRIFNYPKHVWTEAQDEWGVREHTDMGFLTILLQDESGGLQVKTRDGRWIPAPPVKDTFVINIGDMLEVWTHGIYRATPHRVRNEGSGDRLSLPFFFDPNWNSTLEPVDPKLLPASRLARVDARAQTRWDGLDLRKLATRKITYGEFVWDKVKNVFPELATRNKP